jgi:hypothetical protein
MHRSFWVPRACAHLGWLEVRGVGAARGGLKLIFRRPISPVDIPTTPTAKANTFPDASPCQPSRQIRPVATARLYNPAFLAWQPCAGASAARTGPQKDHSGHLPESCRPAHPSRCAGRGGIASPTTVGGASLGHPGCSGNRSHTIPFMPPLAQNGHGAPGQPQAPQQDQTTGTATDLFGRQSLAPGRQQGQGGAPTPPLHRMWRTGDLCAAVETHDVAIKGTEPKTHTEIAANRATSKRPGHPASAPFTGRHIPWGGPSRPRLRPRLPLLANTPMAALSREIDS